MDFSRRGGVLLHPTSLPGPGGIGTLGEEARAFIGFLVKSGLSVWQLLPLGPTGYGNSPYSSYSAFAGNPLLIDLRPLVEEGWLTRDEAACSPVGQRIDYQAVAAHKLPALLQAADRFMAGAPEVQMESFWQFCDTTDWLHDYALFMALKEAHGGSCWSQWPVDIALRTTEAVESYSRELGVAIGRQKFIQWLFHRQWELLRRYAAEHGVLIFGDMPIYVAYDSADVWLNRDLFLLDPKGQPTVVAGVPPDYFSRTGQLWGNPLYDWQNHRSDGFAWWCSRFRSALGQCDLLRIDHFRGFESCWQVPAGEKTAVHGSWLQTPGRELFTAITDKLGPIPLIAEDLGIITPEVEALRDELGCPGMAVLQFAFGSDSNNSHLPHNHQRRSVVYTGTHDNDTTLRWFTSRGKREQTAILDYLRPLHEEMPWPMIRAAFASTAFLAIIPLQDFLSLGRDGRMNSPGIANGNWDWRYDEKSLTASLARHIRYLASMYGRTCDN
jgi:4-alpha-glucanotransferase